MRLAGRPAGVRRIYCRFMPYRSTSPPMYTFSVPGFTRGVKVIVIASAVVWLLLFLGQHGVPLVSAIPWPWFFLYPIQLVHGAVWQLFTYLFIHVTFWQLLFNMFAVWMFGVSVEQALGTRRFYYFYFFCGVGAGLIDVLLHLALGSPGVPTFGADGAAFGILLAFGMMFPEQKIFLLLPPVSIKAKWVVLGWGVLLLLFGAFGGINDLGYLGGMLFAFIFLKGLRGANPFAGVHSGYHRWRRRRLQRRFDVYMRKRDRQGPGANSPN
ncbi:MAG: rhomboid family intramembrane serine protease [Terriglobales bacterium]